MQASQYAGASSSAAANARAAAASAHRQAAEANRAAGQAESLARKAATAAADARDAARSAAQHARNAATAARQAADSAIDAATAAAKSTAHAQAATEAANAASKAAQQAQTVYTLAREVEAAELLGRTNAGIENARDLKAQEAAEKEKRAQEAAATAERQRTAEELARQAQSGTDDEEIARQGRQLALLDMKDGKPWLRAAAQEALGSDTAGVVAYVRTGRAEAQAQDDRSDVERLAEESSVKEVRDAAEAALDGDAATISAFLREGQYEAGRESFRVAIAQAADSGGPNVQDKARQALQTGTTEAYRTFLTKTLAEAQVEDDRVTAAQLVDSGAPEVASAARIALEGPADLLHRFVQAGQYTAQRKDLLAVTHQLQVQQLVAEAAQVAAKAQHDAADAQAHAATARKASAEAQQWATKAQQSSDQADRYATQADQYAKDAEASAQRAAESARTARAAADRADTAARNAARSASDATVSAELAQASAGSAWASAAQAQTSAERAGKSAAEAAQAATEAFVATIQKYREEEETRRRAAVAAKEAKEKEGVTPAELYRCGILGCEAVENPGRWCQHHEVYCDVLSQGPAFEASMKQLNDAINAVTGLTQLENCARKGDLEACWELNRDVVMSAKFRMLGVAYKTLLNLQRGCTQCFLPGTRVLMADGDTVPIEKVQAGDLVRATDPETGETAARRVAQRIVTPDDDKYLAALTIRGPTGERAHLSATHEHPFWSGSLHAWVPAEDLRPGDSLRTDDGTTATVLANQSYLRKTTTYSLTVEGLHSFYVLAGDTPVLVHNSECKVLVLGVREHVGEATTNLKGYNFMDPKYERVEAYLPGGVPFTGWMSGVTNVLRSNGKIAVSLKGFDPPSGTYQQKFNQAVANGQGSNWRSTEWEMAQIAKYHARGDLDWDNVTFYDDLGNVVKIDPPN